MARSPIRKANGVMETRSPIRKANGVMETRRPTKSVTVSFHFYD